MYVLHLTLRQQVFILDRNFRFLIRYPLVVDPCLWTCNFALFGGQLIVIPLLWTLNCGSSVVDP